MDIFSLRNIPSKLTVGRGWPRRKGSRWLETRRVGTPVQSIPRNFSAYSHRDLINCSIFNPGFSSADFADYRINIVKRIVAAGRKCRQFPRWLYLLLIIHNQMEDPQQYNERALIVWISGKSHGKNRKKRFCCIPSFDTSCLTTSRLYVCIEAL